MAAFQIEGKGTSAARLVASQKLTRDDFDAIAAAFGGKVHRARKVGLVAGRLAHERETVATEWANETTTNVAEPGDWIVTNYTPDRKLLLDEQQRINSYVLKPTAFELRYQRDAGETEHGPLFTVKDNTQVDALFVGGLDIVAPWGERQQIGSAYLLRGGNDDIYGNAKQSFEGTYEIVS